LSPSDCYTLLDKAEADQEDEEEEEEDELSGHSLRKTDRKEKSDSHTFSVIHYNPQGVDRVRWSR
jgi:hypothetical protein